MAISTETQRLNHLKMVMPETEVFDQISRHVGLNNTISVGQYLAGERRGAFESPYLARGLQDEIKKSRRMTPERWCERLDKMIYKIETDKDQNLQDYLAFVRFLNTYDMPYDKTTCAGTVLIVGISRKIEALESKLFGTILENFKSYCKDPFGKSFTPSCVHQFEYEYAQVMYRIVGKPPKLLKGWAWRCYTETCRCILEVVPNSSPISRQDATESVDRMVKLTSCMRKAFTHSTS